jgi:hypothetical protein
MRRSTPTIAASNLTGDWRVVPTVEDERVVVVGVGRHNGSSFYSSLAEDYSVSPVGQARDQKPDCCGQEGGRPSGSPALRSARDAGTAADRDTATIAALPAAGTALQTVEPGSCNPGRAAV